MTQGSLPLNQTPRQAAPLPATGVKDGLFGDIGVFSSRAVRLLARDCLFAQLGKGTFGVGGAFAAWVAITEPSFRLNDEELRRGAAGLGVASVQVFPVV